MPQEQNEQPQEQQQIMTRAERKRITNIQALARSAGLTEDEDIVRTAVDTGQSYDAFRSAMVDVLIKREEESPTFPISNTRGMRDAQETTRKLVANAILHRHGFSKTLEPGAEQYRSMSAIDLARDLLAQRGENSRGAPSEVLQRSLHSTSDFPIILGDVTRQTMLNAYAASMNTFTLFGHRNVMTDLREVKVLEIGNGPELEKLTEKGEYKRGTIRESAESFSMAHFGKVIGLTEAMLINDQLGAFARVIASWSGEVARLKGDIAWNVILQNMKLKSDGKELFHADHGNIAVNGALDSGAVEAARKLFRRHRDIDGRQIALTPKFIITGTEYELEAQRVVNATITPSSVKDAVPEAIKSMVPAYEHRIDSIDPKMWFMFADPSETMGRGLQYSYLAGYEAPRMLSRHGFDYDGVEFRLDHYFGAGLTDFRFAVKNPGPST